MRYEFSDGGRSTSKRPKQKNDCVVRALALLTGFSYDEAYEELAKRGRKCGGGTAKVVWKAILKEWGYRKQSFPAIKGVNRVSLKSFAEHYLTGEYLVQMAGHVTFVRNGVVLDAFRPRQDGCVYAVWQIDGAI